VPGTDIHPNQVRRGIEQCYFLCIFHWRFQITSHPILPEWSSSPEYFIRDIDCAIAFTWFLIWKLLDFVWKFNFSCSSRGDYRNSSIKTLVLAQYVGNCHIALKIQNFDFHSKGLWDQTSIPHVSFISQQFSDENHIRFNYPWLLFTKLVLAGNGRRCDWSISNQSTVF
jgi:hypothetical protein